MFETLQLVVSIMMITIVLCLFVQKSTPRLYAAAIFAIIINGHDQLFHALSDNQYWYYISAGGTDLLVVMLISNLKCVPRLAIDLQMVALISIVYNFIGWVLYMKGYDAFIYIALYVVLYGWAIIMLLRGEPRNVGDFTMDSWISIFRINAYSRRVLHRGHKG